MTFSELGLGAKVLSAVEAAGYSEPTPIQAQAIPHVLQGRDVLGIAQTGTGKTASFTLPMLTRLEQGRARARMPRTLILEPTRELAAQVEASFLKYGVNHNLNVALLIGGLSFGDQDAKITRGVDVLIATPGRLLDHFERGKLLLTGIEILVIDEADRMLDMGFIPDIERICKLVPFTRQTLFFSATMPPEITRLTEQFLHNPVRIEVARPATTAAGITQGLVAASSAPHEKRDALRRLIRAQPNFKNAIIFSNRKRDVVTLHKSLEKHAFNAVALHGDLDQRTRLQALDKFKSGDAQLLVASDVAARGLDIPDVSHVFNFDVPHHAEDYVHRIGRTGRAGKSGTAISLVTPEDKRSLAEIEKLIGAPIPWMGEPVAEGEGGDDGRRGRAARSPRGRSPEGPRARRSEAPREAGDGRRASGAPRAEPTESRAPAPRSSAPHPESRAPRGPRPEPARAPDRDRPRRERSYRDDDRDDKPVLGLGDHVPSFLMRPVRAAK